MNGDATSSIRSMSVPARPSRAPSAPWLSPRVLRSGVALSLLVAALVAAFVLVGLGGWSYYTTPLAVRGYAPGHALLRPSGAVGRAFGIAGLALMLAPFLYMLRKRLKRLRSAGNLKTLLEIHLFCGIVGPVLITFHTSFKFNGLVSVAYWSMVIVVLSGFIGRHLYVRIPRTIRGAEVSRAEMEARAETLRAELAELAPPALLARIDALEREALPQSAADLSWLDLVVGEARMRGRLSRFARACRREGRASGPLGEALSVMGERAKLLRTMAYLQRTKRLFDLWHVFHLPLVYVMLLIVVFHVAVVAYLGYAGFGS